MIASTASFTVAARSTAYPASSSTIAITRSSVEVVLDHQDRPLVQELLLLGVRLLGASGSGRRAGGRQDEGERGALVDRAGDPQGAVLELGQALGDGQPSPAPSVAAEPFSNGTKIRSSCSAVIPIPVSLTSRTTSSADTCASTQTRPPALVNLTALTSRLNRIWRRRSGSART